ncbi:MAG TPA: metalloregulator ArsR/SmtB family transcription factor [Ktedonobacterales bacterium]|jgi:DNA-binding transcriptional ArsR family regulator|nr:metalloregulator ArsR/SmtB family transcription factor [Ktedonobacterales bacterium]
MPSPSRAERTLAPLSLQLSVDLAPAISALDSLMLLNSVSEVSGLPDWVVRTAAALPPKLAHVNRLVQYGLYFAVAPREGSWPSFPAYIDELAAHTTEALRGRLLDGLLLHLTGQPASDIERSRLLESQEAYLGFLRAHASREPLDVELEAEVYALLTAPARMHELIVSHLRTMWERYLAPEWERALPLLQASVTALRRLPLDGLSIREAVRAVTGHQLLGERETILGNARRIIFVPSVHKGPYLDTFTHGDLLWLIFQARIPAGAADTTEASAELARSSLLAQLNALTDETRLRILALLRQHDELCAQEILSRLHITQSAASRHLRQLRAAGYLTERRQDNAKCYSLNPEGVAEALHALDTCLRGV